VAVEVAELLAEAPRRPHITVVQALPKGDRGTLAADLMTEAGVDAIVPWQAARSIVRWTGERGAKQQASWRAAVREAAKQSRRLTAPAVADLASTAAVAELLAAAPRAVVCHETAATPLWRWYGQLAPGGDPAAPTVLVIGPEGGVAPDELAAFEAAGASPCGLGPTVLRTSTAGAVAVAQVRLLAALAEAAR
jgi:16S rRNA (uracil1498-N3)-methyltransferase